MSFIRSDFRHPSSTTNVLGLTQKHYEGSISTLCAGCGHDSISAAIIQSCFELALPPHRIAKLSGIGCSSKTPTYFLGRSHGFNAVHGRMPSVATGANLANRDMCYIGVSGDGDTASIGVGQFIHAARRNLDMLYIVENNGCYGLTKGQDSATADRGSRSRKGSPSMYTSIDLCGLMVQAGASFVARGFSGDKKQLVNLIKAAIRHKGFAFIDVVSPCVTFNNNPESTKSYTYARENDMPLPVDFVEVQEELSVTLPAGKQHEVRLHDGSKVYFYQVDDHYDPLDHRHAMDFILRMREQNKVPTGLLYLSPDTDELHETLNTPVQPLNNMVEADLCPGDQALQTINQSLQ